MGRAYRNRVTFSRGRLASAVLACGVSTALVLASSGAAFAASGFHVVPARGKIAGEGYGYYLQREWQIRLDPSSAGTPCHTVAVHGKRVGLLTLTTSGPVTVSYSCREPAGRPIYAVGLSNECSSFQGDHGTFGTSGSQLRKCAVSVYKGAKDTATVDGHPVNVTHLITTTGVYVVPKQNIFGSGKGRSVAHGYGLLFTGFSKGIHVIHALASIGTSRWDITWTLHVH